MYQNINYLLRRTCKTKKSRISFFFCSNDREEVRNENMKESTMTEKTKKDILIEDKTPHQEPKFSLPTFTLDVEKYEHYLEESNLTDKQKEEFLQTLWIIICEFVSLGFGVHPLQQAMEAPCGKDIKNHTKPALRNKYKIELNHKKPIGDFVTATNSETDQSRKGNNSC